MSDFGTVWREFEANEITHSAAHYLLAVAAAVKAGTAPRAVDVSRTLGVSRAAASLQLKHLKEAGLLTSADDHTIHLTQEGADLVARIAGKREAVRLFLTDVLGVDPEVAELDACKVEHLISEETGAALVRLTRYLTSGLPSTSQCMKGFAEFSSLLGPDALDTLSVEGCLRAMAARDDDGREPAS